MSLRFLELAGLHVRCSTLIAAIGMVLALGAADPFSANAQCCGSEASASNRDSSRRVLRVAADPNSLPFNNERGEGFENRIAELLAREMNVELQYVWHAQRRGFFRRTMSEGDCQVALGAPAGFERALTTRPYYRSMYVFVMRADRNLKIRSLDDPRLRELKIGVQVIGDDGLNTPPAHALSERGIVDNVIGYSVYGDYSRPNPTSRIIEAVVNGDLDLAMAWGPMAGYFASRQSVALELAPLATHDELSGQQFVFDICVGVRKDSPGLREEIDAILARCQREIDGILDEYHVPRLPLEEPSREPEE